MLGCAGHARPVLCYPGSPAQGGCLWGLEANQVINLPLFPAVHVPRRPPGGSVLPAFGAAPLLSLPEPESPDRGLCLVVGEQESERAGAAWRVLWSSQMFSDSLPSARAWRALRCRCSFHPPGRPGCGRITPPER